MRSSRVLEFDVISFVVSSIDPNVGEDRIKCVPLS